VHGIDYYTREQEAKAILSGNLELTKSLSPHISYIVMPTKQITTPSTGEFTEVFSNQKFTILQTRFP
jgi:hypothetical protein